MNTMMNDAESAPERIARMALLNNVLQNTATGPLAGPSGTVGRVALALGISPDTLKTLNIDPSQPTNNEIAQKLAGELVVGSIGAKNGGFPASNFSIAERQFIESMFPNIMNQPGSNQAVSDVLIAKDQRALQKAGEWRQFKNTARTGGQTPSYADFEDQWLENHQNDNVFQPIIDKFQAGGYGPPGAPPPAPGGALNAPASPAAPQAGSAAAAAPQLPAKAPLANGGQPMSPQDAAKLPKGSHFMGLDDQERIVR
jgi:hypothetical protein